MSSPATQQPQTSTLTPPPIPFPFPSPPLPPFPPSPPPLPPFPPISPTLPTNTPPPFKVDLSTLPTPQLTSVKNQLTQELQHLTTSYAQLKQAQAKFADCGVSVREGVVGRGEGMFFVFYFYYRGLG